MATVFNIKPCNELIIAQELTGLSWCLKRNVAVFRSPSCKLKSVEIFTVCIYLCLKVKNNVGTK